MNRVSRNPEGGAAPPLPAELLQRIQRLLEARAADPAMQGVPGGETGLVKCVVKRIGRGQNALLVREFVFDAALAKELRALEAKQDQSTGARELGSGTVSVATVDPRLRDLTNDELAALKSAVRKLRDAGPAVTPETGSGGTT